MSRSPRVLQTSFLPLLLLLALLVPLATAFCDQAQDAIAFAAFTDWCLVRFEGAVITDEVREKSGFAGRWCRTGDGDLRSIVAYDLKADQDGFAKRRNAVLGDSPACEKAGGDATFCAGGIEWVRGGYKFYIMLWRKQPHSEALGKALIATARQEAARLDTTVSEALKLGVPPPERPGEPPIVRSRVVVFDRSNCLSTAEGYKQMVEAVGSAAAMMDRRYAFARDQAPPSEQTSQDMGAFEMALISYDGRNSTLESDFTHQGKDLVTAVSKMHGRAQVEQTGPGAGGPTGAGAQDLATHIARAALYANMFGRGVPDVAVVTCGAKPAMSGQTAKALASVLARLAIFSRHVPSATGSLEPPGGPRLGCLPAAGGLPWWACLVQAALGQTVPRPLGGPNDTLEVLVAELEAAGTRAQKPTRANVVGIRFETDGEQEKLLVSVCSAAGGRYVPSATVGDMPRSFLSLFPAAGQPWPQPTGTAAGPQVAQIPGGGGMPTVTAGGGDDELRLRDGRVLRGTLVSADDRAIVFRTGGQVASWPRPQVAAIILGQVTQSPGLPPEISLAPGLTAVRWMSFHRLPRFELGPVAHAVSAARISADGQRLIVGAYEGGTASLNADGSGLTRLAEARNDGLVDISADGRRVVWSDVTGLYAARGDGAGRQKLAEGFRVLSLRLTADGSRVYVMTPDKGILLLKTDGSDVKRVVSLEDAAGLAGIAPNGNSWHGLPSGLDVSDDGSRLVFHFGRNVMACAGDGSGLHRLTDFEPAKDSTVKMVRISGDGQRVGWLRIAPQLSLTLQDWDGGNVVVHRETGLRETLFLQLSRDGNTALTSQGARLYGGRDEMFVNLTQWGQSNYEAIYNTTMASFTADARRVLLVADGPISPDPARLCPLIIADLNSMTLGDVPPLRGINVQPRFLLTYGTTNATATVQTGHANLADVGLGALIGGELASAFYYRGLPLLDKGKDGDAQDGDGIFSSNALRISKASDPKVAPGPMLLRVFAETKTNDALVVDFTGVEARTP